MATALDDAYHPVDIAKAYSPMDTFAVSVEIQGYQEDGSLIARWFYEGTKITDTPLTGNLRGDITAGFVLQNENPPWPTGEYSVEILYKDRALAKTSFMVDATGD